LVFNAVGLSRDPVGYIKHLWGPVWWLGFLLFPIELISLCVRPVALGIRLTANIFGDHQVFVIFSSLVPLVVPAALLTLAILVSTIQAFIFSLLTTIYIGLSVPHSDDH
jgi:F-type H+-transporting ATPase subunit a